MKFYILILFFFIFLALSCKKLPNDRVIAVTTADATVLTSKITALGEIIDIGENSVSDYGFCYSFEPNANINSNIISLGHSYETKSFQSMLYQISAGENVYIKAYAKDKNSITYGREIQVKAPMDGIVLLMQEPFIISGNSIILNANIENIGSLKIESAGIAINHAESPDYKNSIFEISHVTNDTLLRHTAINLDFEVKYYCRAYVKLSDDVYLYSTSKVASIPDFSIVTDTFAISNNEITLQGSIIKIGIEPIIEYGFCYSHTTSNPNYNNEKSFHLSTPAKPEIYYYTINNLKSNTTYYYRAYATTGQRIKYGKIKVLKTP